MIRRVILHAFLLLFVANILSGIQYNLLASPIGWRNSFEIEQATEELECKLTLLLDSFVPGDLVAPMDLEIQLIGQKYAIYFDRWILKLPIADGLVLTEGNYQKDSTIGVLSDDDMRQIFVLLLPNLVGTGERLAIQNNHEILRIKTSVGTKVYSPIQGSTFVIPAPEPTEINPEPKFLDTLQISRIQPQCTIVLHPFDLFNDLLPEVMMGSELGHTEVDFNNGVISMSVWYPNPGSYLIWIIEENALSN